MESLKGYSKTLKQIVGEIIDENFPISQPSSVDTYQDLVAYEKRCIESNRLCEKYPGYVPVIVNSNNRDIKIAKHKYLVPRETYCSRLMVSMRTQMSVESYQAMFLFVDDTLLDNMRTIGEIYDKYLLKNKITSSGDKYFYVNLSMENTFGIFN